DVPSLKEAIAEKEEAMSQPEFWDDQQKAKEVSRELTQLKSRLGTWERTFGRFEDLEVLHELAEDEGDEEAQGEVAQGIADLERDLERLELESLFNGEYDDHNAILSIHPGAGGTESQ